MATNTLEDQIRSQWGQYGDWNAAGQDQVARLAALLSSKGVTDLSRLKFSQRTLTDPSYQQPITEDAFAEMGPQDRQVWDAFYGENPLGFAGDINADGTFGQGAQWVDGMDPAQLGVSGDLLGWSAEGGGNTSFRLVPGPDGNPVVAPIWASSSEDDLTNAKMIAMMAAMAYGGSALGGASAGGTAGAETMANGAFLGEGVSSGIGAWDAAAVNSALASGEYATAASYAGQNLANGTLTDTISNAVSPNNLPTSNPTSGGSTSGSWNGTDFSGPPSTSGGSNVSNLGKTVSNAKNLTDLTKAGVAVAGTALAPKDESMANDPNLTQIPPAQLLPILEQMSTTKQNDAISQSRYNVSGPNGSSTWSQTPQFDEAGYNAAMANWTSAGNANLPKPTQDQFTTKTWTNTQTADPAQKALYDSNLANSQAASGALYQTGVNYADKVNTGADRSGIPGYQFGTSIDKQGQIDPATAGPKYQGVSTQQMATPQYGTVNRGAIQNSVDTSMRDWAGSTSGKVNSLTDRMTSMNPWAYDDKGADAMYRMQTRYLEPQQAANQKAMEARLGEQGFVPGTPAYDTALRQMLDSNSQAMQQARDSATLAGRQFGDQAFDNESGNLNNAIAQLISSGRLGLDQDATQVRNNLDAGEFFNKAQGQDFDQQELLSGRVRQTGLDANAVAKDLFDMDFRGAEMANKNATDSSDFALRSLDANNKAIAGNNDAALMANRDYNSAVTDAGNMANKNYDTDTDALQRLFKDLRDTAAPPDALATPGAGISNVNPGSSPDLAQILQQYFSNNVDLKNADTASSNAERQSYGQLISALLPYLLG